MKKDKKLVSESKTKKLISENLAAVVEAKIAKMQPELKPLDTSGYFRMAVGGVILKRYNNECELHLSEYTTSKYMGEWREDVGKFAFDDLKTGGTHLFEVYLDTCRVVLLEVDGNKTAKRMSEFKIPIIGIGGVLTGKRQFAIVRIYEKNEPYSAISVKSAVKLSSYFSDVEFEKELQERGECVEEEPQQSKKRITPALF